MSCNIIWKDLNISEWQGLLKGFSFVPLPQAPAYGLALQKLYGQKPIFFGLVQKDTLIGGFQMMESKALILKANILDRGPLFISEALRASNMQEFAMQFSKRYPSKCLKRRRFIPEWGGDHAFPGLMKEYGFQRRQGAGYETLLLDLRPDITELRAALRGSWRGHLNKSERAALRIVETFNPQHAPSFFLSYAVHKREKNYPGPDAAFLKTLAFAFAAQGDMLILQAYEGVQPLPCAGAMFLIHGPSATYQAAWSDKEGRQKSAPNILIWQGIQALKARGITTLDLGGINNEGASGVKVFKQGLGAATQVLSGLYT